MLAQHISPTDNNAAVGEHGHSSYAHDGAGHRLCGQNFCKLHCRSQFCFYAR